MAGRVLDDVAGLVGVAALLVGTGALGVHGQEAAQHHAVAQGLGQLQVAVVGEGGDGQDGEVAEHPRQVEGPGDQRRRLAEQRQPARRLRPLALDAPRLGDVGDDQADTERHVGAGGGHRVEADLELAVRALRRAVPGARLQPDDGAAGRQHLLDERLERLGVGDHLAQAPAQVRRHRVAVVTRQGLVDPQVAQVAVQERQAHGRLQQQRLEQREGLALLPLRPLAVGDVPHQHRHGVGPPVPGHGIGGHQPRAPLAGGLGQLAGQQALRGGPAGVQDLAEHGGGAERGARHDLRQRPAEVVGDRHAVDLGERLVHRQVAQLAVEHGESHRRRGQQRVEHGQGQRSGQVDEVRARFREAHPSIIPQPGSTNHPGPRQSSRAAGSIVSVRPVTARLTAHRATPTRSRIPARSTSAGWSASR